MEEILKYITELKNQSFIHWSQDAIDGYNTALGSIEAKIKLIKGENENKMVGNDNADYEKICQIISDMKDTAFQSGVMSHFIRW